jgi:PAS domain S-box-containing protein
MHARWLRALLKSNVLAMGCWRIGGHLTAKNNALLSLLGYTQKEITAKKIRMRDITPPEFWPLDLLALKEAQASGECVPFEKEIIHKSGRRIPVLFGGSVFGDGVNDADAFFFVDLAGRKRTLKDPKRVVPPALLFFTDRHRQGSPVLCLDRKQWSEPMPRRMCAGFQILPAFGYRIFQVLNTFQHCLLLCVHRRSSFMAAGGRGSR